MDVHYRHVGTLEKNYAVSATFAGTPSTPEEIERLLEASHAEAPHARSRANRARAAFSRIPDRCPRANWSMNSGLKGTRVGGAKVSEIHGNFIVNEGGATASDVLALIAQIKEKALRERGIKLETEVQIVGEEKGSMTE